MKKTLASGNVGHTVNNSVRSAGITGKTEKSCTDGASNAEKQCEVIVENLHTVADTNTGRTVDQRQTTYGYIRVSTREQNEARQVDAMKKFGVDHMVMDKQSGKDFNRPAYQRLIGALKPGDVLVVKSIDRLGRNYSDILEQWRIITKEKKAAIVVLDMPLLDTRANRDLTGTLIADIVLQLLSYVAETERAFIKQRQREGIDAALARGQRFGSPPKERPAEFTYFAELWTEGKITARQAAKKLNVAHSTFLYWARETMAERGYSRCEKGVRPVAPGQSCDPMLSGRGLYGGLPKEMGRSVLTTYPTGISKATRK